MTLDFVTIVARRTSKAPVSEGGWSAIPVIWSAIDLVNPLSDPAVFKDRPTEVPGLVAGLDAARAEVERLFARWQELDAIHKASPR